jgi:hypothetical protein
MEILYIFLTILLTAFSSSIIPRKIEERKRFIVAADKFKSSFLEEIAFIDHNRARDRAGRDIPGVLASAAEKHETALITFMEFLGERQRKKIEQAWKEYTGEDKLMGKYTFKQYATYGKFKDTDNIRKCALERIEKLMQFAKPKWGFIKNPLLFTLKNIL